MYWCFSNTISLSKWVNNWIIGKKVFKNFLQILTYLHSKIAKLSKVAKSLVGDILRRYKETQTIKRKRGGGRKKGFVEKNKVNLIIPSITRNPCQSQRDLAKKFKCSHFLVREVLKSKGLKAYTKKKVLKLSIDGELKAIRWSRKLVKLFNRENLCIIEDDKTYCKKDFSKLPGNQYYYQSKGDYVGNKFKYTQTERFARKILVWQAICSCSLKSATFVTLKTLTSNLYINECLQKCLLPFNNKHSKAVIFWPDLATIHYSKKTMEWYNQNGIEIVPKDANPWNCPEQRVIWALVKGILLKSNKSAKDDEEFKRKWIAASKKVTESKIQAMMAINLQKIWLLSKHSLKSVQTD